jgi:hypothetical protein
MPDIPTDETTELPQYGASNMTCRINRATGTRSAITVQEETCWGVLAEDSDPAVAMEALGVDFATETIRNDINDIESNLIRSDRMRSPSQQGNWRPGGDLNGELQPHGIWPLILKHVLGGDVTTVGSRPYTHSLLGSLNLPEGLTLEKRFGFPDGTYKYLRYLGGKVNEFGLEVPTEGIVTCRAGFIFKDEQEVESPMDAAPTYPTDNEPFNAFQGSIYMDLNGNGIRTAIASITSLSLLIANSIDGDQFAIDGAQGRADAPEDQRIINGNLVAFFTDNNYKLYQAYRDNTSLSMELLLQRGSYAMQFTIPQFKVRGNPTPQTSGRGPLNLEVAWQAHRDDDLGTDIEVSITNNDPVLSTAA